MAGQLLPIPKLRVHIITGFLGAGKTTLIRALLAQKPATERWGVLVNEFGEVGVDGALLADTGVTIKEVVGGCMCCVAGVPMRVALTQLLRSQTLDCLLIEPSGLGHARDILAQLRAPEFANVLSIGAVVTVVDPHKLIESRYREHPVYLSQISAATILVATKSDQATTAELANFTAVAAALPHRPYAVSVANGALDIELLNTNIVSASAAEPVASRGLSARMTSAFTEPDMMVMSGHEYQVRVNATDEFVSLGWVTGPKVRFSPDLLSQWLWLLAPLRAKALVNTAQTCWSLNMLEGQASEQFTELSTAPDSRIECIFERSLFDPTSAAIAALTSSFRGCVTEASKLHEIE